MRRFFSLGLLLGILSFVPPPAAGLQTPIFPGGGSEPDLVDILDGLYGLGNLQRVDDLNDQIWSNINGGAVAKAKYAGYALDFGYIDDGGFNLLFSTPANYMGDLPASYTGLTPDHAILPDFRWGIQTSAGDTWSSLMTENPDGGLDHMVTWKVLDEVDTYVVAWEDLFTLGDHDYQDLVVEVSHVTIPDATTLSLLGSAMVIAALFGRRKRFDA